MWFFTNNDYNNMNELDTDHYNETNVDNKTIIETNDVETITDNEISNIYNDLSTIANIETNPNLNIQIFFNDMEKKYNQMSMMYKDLESKYNKLLEENEKLKNESTELKILNIMAFGEILTQVENVKKYCDRKLNEKNDSVIKSIENIKKQQTIDKNKLGELELFIETSNKYFDEKIYNWKQQISE